MTDVQLIVERGIYDALLSKLIELGYYVDITDETAYPNTAVGKNNLTLALKAISDNKGYYVDLKGFSVLDNKGMRNIPSISLVEGNFIPGDIGSEPCGFFDSVPTGFVLKKRQPMSQDYFFTVIGSYDSIGQSRLINNVINSSLQKLSYITVNVGGDDTEFFVEMVGQQLSPDGDKGITESFFTFRVPDLFLFEDVGEDIVPAISEITLEINETNNTKYVKQ